MKTRLLHIIFIVFAGLLLSQVMFSQSKDTLPEPDRLAEDFVYVSLCIADPTDWREDALGTSGHAFIRMQCPYYNLDNCFSYEGESVNDNLLKYFSGETKMGMFAFYTSGYLQEYKKWNRSVHEYRLNLPPQVETRLWEILDNHLTNRNILTQDLNRYGCAITVVKRIKEALDTIPIVYASNPDFERLSRREIGYRSFENEPWFRLHSMLFTDSRYDKDCPIDEKLIVPADLAEIWQNATVCDKPLAVYEKDLVEGAPVDTSKPWFTPVLAAILILLITIGFAFTDIPYWDWLLLAIQVIAGLLLIFMWIIMANFSMSAYILMLLFTPLTAVFWKWRRYWSLPYAGILLVWTIVLTCLPHMLIDPAFLVFSLSYIVMFSKDGIKRFISDRK